jgi:lipopolysaccharide biosynthesis glycosyltransferase
MHTFLYILIWRSGEDYADITFLSMSFLKKVHPEAQILLLTDPETAKALHDASHLLLSLVESVIESEAPHRSSSMKSWFLKSRMRRLVGGDFIFLDADTIVRQRLDALFQIDAPVALSENHSLRFPENFPEMERQVYERNGWPLPGNGHYLNSGVIVWKDHPQAHRLAEIWEQYWDASAANGYGYDQPALNRAIEWSGVTCHVLDDAYNAQICANPSSGVDAAVWHFYQSDRRWFPDDWFSRGLRTIREGQSISATWIDQVCQARIPWLVHEHVAEQPFIDHLRNGCQLNSSTYEQLTGTELPSTSNATVCTIITANYLPYARALLESVRAFEPDIHFNILISDTDQDLFSGEVADRHVFFHFAEEVCRSGIGQLIRNKYQSSDHDAFRWSCKPVFINHLIRENGYERVLYFDCDIYIFHKFRFLFDELKTNNVLLTPHWRTSEPEADPEEYRFLFNHGLYNAGFIGANTHGTKAMDWWARCCLHSCARGSFEGEFVDQSILNLMPVYFEGVHVLRHKGCNVAIWNRNECKRVIQADGSIKIADFYPVVFIHFSAGIPRSWDPMLGSYMDRYLASLKRFDKKVWERELHKRKLGRDTYIEQKSRLYLNIKRRVVKARLSWLPYPTEGNVAILAQSGTFQQCLGLSLRQVPGTVLSSIPVIQWSGDGIDTMDKKITAYRPFDGSRRSMDNMLKDAMIGHLADPVYVNWAHWSSLIRIKRMVFNFPEGSLCWPELAEIIGQQHKVIALVSHPGPFAERMMALYGDGRNLDCMTSTRAYLQQYPEQLPGLEDMHLAEYAWVIKWCLDMKALENSSASGRRIQILREEDLMNNTRETLSQLLIDLEWNWKGDIGTHFPTFCRFHDPAPKNAKVDPSPDIHHARIALDQLIQSFGIKTYALHGTSKATGHPPLIHEDC